jgi:hypothetical protein
VYIESSNSALYGKVVFLPPELPGGYDLSFGKMRECDDDIFVFFHEAKIKRNCDHHLKRKYHRHHCL